MNPYKAALAITKVIKDTSTEIIYHEFETESAQSREWLTKLSLFYDFHFI